MVDKTIDTLDALSGSLSVSSKFIVAESGSDLLKRATGQQVKDFIGGGTAATTAFTPAGNVSATDVQSAIVELDTKKLGISGGMVGIGTASPVSNLDVRGTFAVNPGTFFTAVDSTAQFVISGTTAPVYINLSPGTPFYLRGNVAATSVAPSKPSVALRFSGSRWNGSYSSGLQASVSVVPRQNIDESYLKFGFPDVLEEMLNLTHGGRFGIGTTTPAESLHVVGNVYVSGVIKPSPFTVSTLPSASTSGSGARAYVVDATSTVPRSIAAGGGSTKSQVWSDGANWLIA